MKINLITWDGKPWFTNRIKQYPGIQFAENCYDDVEWDVVAFYENTMVQYSTFKTKYVLLLSGEPPYACVYPNKYLSQFDKVVTCNYLINHRDVLHEQPSEPIHIGRSWETGLFSMDYERLYNIEKPTTLKPISLMASTLNWLPGHRKRMDLVNNIIESGLPIDIFGRGRKYVDDKKDAILPYMFHICIENDSVEDYWTEKIADPIVCKTIPIYYGCPNIEKYFNRDCLIVVKNEKDFVKKIKEVLDDPFGLYERMLPSLLKERNKIFDKYNIIETILHCEFDLNKEVKRIRIASKETFPSYKILLYSNMIQLKYKKIFNL